MRKAVILLLIFLVMLLAPLAVRYFQYYRPFTAARAAPPAYSAAGIAPVPTPAAGDFRDAPELSRAVANSAGGVVLLDQAHDNQFTLEEIATLDGLLAGRGYEVASFTEGDLAAALRPAGALVVITPISYYTAEEALAVREFVSRGGRLLLVGDPTRYNIEFDETNIFAPPIIRTAQVPLNDLANAFDITFRGDYLYNVTESEGNFRNILLDEADFAADPLTDGLERLAFYSSHSLQTGPTAAPLLIGDDNTWSSATDRPGGLALAAVSPAEAGDGGRVLALGDFHFLLEPYNAVYDNGAFAARVADFLTADGTTAAGLAGFPRFLSGPVDLTYSGGPELGPDAFDEVVALQGALRAVGLPLNLTAEPDPAHDTIILGLYNQAEDAADLLERAGVELRISPAIQPPAEEEADNENDESAGEPSGTRLIDSPLGTLQMSGSALILLDTDGDRQRVVVLAASNDGLESAAGRLRAGGGIDLTDCLLQGDLAVCPTGIANEPVEYELVTSGPGEATEEPDEGTGEPERSEGDGAPPVEASAQGAIAIDETKNGELAAEEAHAWTFSGGPATIDIVVDGDEDIDVVLELYDPDQQLMGNVDSTFAGGTEEMRGIEIPDDGDYTIRIRDFFNDGGSYELAVTAGEPEDESTAPGNRVFIFADDDGEPIDEGLTSTAVFVELLADAYDVTTWTASVDGPLPEDTLQDYDLLIWDSGTYRDPDGLFGEDTGTIITYLDGGGDLFVTGSSPTLLSEVELSPLASVAIAAAPGLTDGFEDGDVLVLDAEYQAALPAVGEPAADETVFLIRPPDEEGAGEVVAIAAVETSPVDQRTIFLFVPFAALPADARVSLLENIMAWFAA